MAPPRKSPPPPPLPRSSPPRNIMDLDEMGGSVMINTPGGTVRRSLRSRTFDDPADIISSPSTLVRKGKNGILDFSDSPSHNRRKTITHPLMTPIQPMSRIASQINNNTTTSSKVSISPPSPSNRLFVGKTPSTVRSSRSHSQVLHDYAPTYPALSNSFFDYQEVQDFYDDHNSPSPPLATVPPIPLKKESFFNRLFGAGVGAEIVKKEREDDNYPSYFSRIRKVILFLGIILFFFVTFTFNFKSLLSFLESKKSTPQYESINFEEGKFVELDIAIKMTREMIQREKAELQEGTRKLKSQIDEIIEKYFYLENDLKGKIDRFSSDLPSLSDSLTNLKEKVDGIPLQPPMETKQVQQTQDFTNDIKSLKHISHSLGEEIAKLKLLTTAPPPPPSPSSSNIPPLQKGQNTLEYKSDFYIDFASPLLGTRIIPSSTSKSFNHKTKSSSLFTDYSLTGFLKGLLFKNLPRSSTSQLTSSLNPYLALSPDLTPGNCWSFAGRQGQITISLGQEIIPTHFTIEHVDPRFLGPNGPIDRTSAPRLLSVWALFKLPSDSGGDTSDSSAISSSGDEPPLSPSPPPIKIADWTFGEGGQMKKTVSAKIILGEPIRLLQLRIEDNYGKKDYTCLYRWRVHSIHDDDYYEENLSFGQDLQ